MTDLVPLDDPAPPGAAPDGPEARDRWQRAIEAALDGAAFFALDARARALERAPPPDVAERLEAARIERGCAVVDDAVAAARRAHPRAPAVALLREVADRPLPFDLQRAVGRLRAAAALEVVLDAALAPDLAAILAAPPSLAGDLRERLLVRATALRGPERREFARALRVLAATPVGRDALALEPALHEGLRRALDPGRAARLILLGLGLLVFAVIGFQHGFGLLVLAVLALSWVRVREGLR